MKGFLSALQFLTVIPVKIKGGVSDEEISSSAAWFPAVGLIVGIFLAFAYEALSHVFPAPVVCAFVLTLSEAVTGGLHIDGFIDTMDGIASGADRKRALEIMHEGRPGALGLAAVILLFLSKYSLLLSLPKGTVEISLVAMSVVSRASFVASAVFYPYAREGSEGLGKIFIGKVKRPAAMIAAVTLLAAVIFILRAGALIMLPAAAAAFIVCNFYFKRKLGGVTGDTIGAVGEVLEVIVLAAAVALPAGALAYADDDIRIVSITPATTEIACALGLEKELVGVSTFCDYPPSVKNKEKIGSFSDPNIEKIIMLKPDAVLATGLEQAQAVEKMKKLGLNVIPVEPGDFEGLFRSVTEIGKACGKEKRASELVRDMRRSLDSLRGKVSGIGASLRPKVYFEIWNDPIMTAGKGSFIDEMIS
ncbi:MAG: adenosylcobinamide-GDP ribazoletransferase, partial [Candidatus Omnitrophica bacterium]|nr:adenosylcobinamide-GDP ribazoletransferase [Candidatus Omnitrophota bacterium]